MNRGLVLIRGAGDLATGIALRLFRAGFSVAMTDLPQPTAIRRTVCFSEAIGRGEATVEGLRAVFAPDVHAVREITESGAVAVLADPEMKCRSALRPVAIVDAILAKKNLGTKITDCPIVVGVGPGFTAGADCHCAVETMRGHDLGRVLYDGSPMKNTGVPGMIGGFSSERVLRAPCDGIFRACKQIGDVVAQGEIAAMVGAVPMLCTISGVLRGLLPDGTQVTVGMKSGDIDPRCEVSHCYRVSDKANAVAGGVLEAILHFLPKPADNA